jgi:tetratricopeptide (TPR) repeat protein
VCHVFALATLVLSVQLGRSHTAVAQHAAYARGSTETAEELAKRSLDCLRRGEDAVAQDAKLAAYREGLDLATRAVAIDDKSANAHFAVFANNGRILMGEGVTANPLNLLTVNRELDRVLELNPNHTDALAARGGMYRQLPRLLGGSLDKAEQYLSRAVELDPNAVGARIELAQTYRDMGRPERAVPLLEKAAQLADRMGKQRQLAQARSLLRELTPKQ